MARMLLPLAFLVTLVSLLLFANRSTTTQTPTLAAVQATDTPAPAGEERALADPGDLGIVAAPVASDTARVEAFGAAAPEVQDPGFDLARLAVPNAILIDENTNRPLAGAICQIIDANGIGMIVGTDDQGRLLTDEMALTGQVTLGILDGVQRRRVVALDRPGRPKSYVIEHGRLGLLGQQSTRFVTHSGNPALPDRWRTGLTRWVPLEFTGPSVKESPIHLHLVDGQGTFRNYPGPTKTPSDHGIDASVMPVSQDAHPLVFPAVLSVSDVPSNGGGVDLSGFPSWSQQRINEPAPGRLVRAVRFQNQEVLVAEADANVVPFLYQLPLRLDFAPLVTRDVALIRSLYGNEHLKNGLDQRIIDFLDLDDPNAAPTGPVTGTVTSESGQFHGNVSVTARLKQPSHNSWGGGESEMVAVIWKRDDSGAWVGSFDFQDLPLVDHVLELKNRDDHVIAPASATAHPPYEFAPGSFVVRDQIEYVPIEVEIREPDGTRASRFYLEMRSEYKNDGRGIGHFMMTVADEAGAHVVEPRFPRGVAFEVTIEADGHQKLELTQDDFTFDGTRLVCARTLVAVK